MPLVRRRVDDRWSRMLPRADTGPIHAIGRTCTHAVSRSWHGPGMARSAAARTSPGPTLARPGPGALGPPIRARRLAKRVCALTAGGGGDLGVHAREPVAIP